MTRQHFKNLPTVDTDLERLLEHARSLLPMTPEEREAQRRSFAYGNCAIENPDVTREVVDRAAEKLESDRMRLFGITQTPKCLNAMPAQHLGAYVGPVHPDIMRVEFKKDGKGK